MEGFWDKLEIITITTETTIITTKTKTITHSRTKYYYWPESDQVLKQGFWTNNNKTKTMKTTTTIDHLLLTPFWSNFKVRFLWPTIIETRLISIESQPKKDVVVVIIVGHKNLSLILF